MSMERTVSIIKPDATKRNLTGLINQRLEQAGFRIIAQKRIHMTLELSQKFYSVHKGHPYFEILSRFMCSGPIIVQILEGEDVVNKNRAIMGNTIPEKADEGTIRKDFGLNVAENSIHGSESIERAQYEIEFFFRPNEIVG